MESNQPYDLEIPDVIESESQNNPVAGLVERFFAYIIDTMFLTMAIGVLALSMKTNVFRLGYAANLIGFTIAMAYYTLLHGPLGKGQTLGKRIMKIRVVANDGYPIAIGSALIRAAIFLLPSFISDLPILPLNTPRLVSLILNSIITGFSFATYYLILFNRQTRQGFPDLLAKTYVVPIRNTHRPVVTNPVWRGHMVILILLFVAMLGASYSFSTFVLRTDSDLLALDDMSFRQGMPTRFSAAITTSQTGAEVTKTLNITLRPVLSSDNDDELIRKAAQILLKQPDLNWDSYDRLQIIVHHEANFGYYKYTVQNQQNGTVAEWRALTTEN